MCDDKCKNDAPCEECAASPDYWCDDVEEIREFNIEEDKRVEG